MQAVLILFNPFFNFAFPIEIASVGSNIDDHYKSYQFYLFDDDNKCIFNKFVKFNDKEYKSEEFEQISVDGERHGLPDDLEPFYRVEFDPFGSSNIDLTFVGTDENFDGYKQFDQVVDDLKGFKEIQGLPSVCLILLS